MGNILSLDLEFNLPSRKIIQIGACVGDLKNGKIIDSIEVTINPEERICPFVTKLTGIDNSNIKNSGLISDGYRDLVKFCRMNDIGKIPITWGNVDVLLLNNQVSSLEDEILFKSWIDVKTVYQTYRIANGLQTNGGIKAAQKMLGISSAGAHHNARIDAINTFLIYNELIKKFC